MSFQCRLYGCPQKHCPPSAQAGGKGAPQIPYVDERGETFDFHAFRHSFATLMNSSRVPLLTAQKMMRHSTAELTAHYTHADLEEKERAMAALPVIRARQEAPEEKCTGKCTVSTDDSGLVLTFPELCAGDERDSEWARKNPGSACEISSSRVFDSGAGEPAHTIGTTRVVIRWRLSAGKIARFA